MLWLAFGLFMVLLYRSGHFNEFLSYRELRLLEEHVDQAYDDATWEDRMNDFRQKHPALVQRSYMSFGRR